jgi:hypothetical protein
MLRKLFCVAALAAFLLPATAQANFDQGDWEMTLGGSGSNNDDFDAGSGAVSGSLGYFFTDALEVSLRQSVAYADSGPSDAWSGTTRVALDFHFDLGNARPFIGANFGGIYGKGVEETFIAGPEAGLKYFVNTTTFVFFTAEYQFLFEDSDDISDTIDDGQFVYSLGLGFRW